MKKTWLKYSGVGLAFLTGMLVGAGLAFALVNVVSDRYVGVGGAMYSMAAFFVGGQVLILLCGVAAAVAVGYKLFPAGSRLRAISIGCATSFFIASLAAFVYSTFVVVG